MTNVLYLHLVCSEDINIYYKKMLRY